MPEAAMHKNDFSSPGKYKVWPAGKGSAVQTVSVPHAMDKFSDPHFRAGMFAVNAGHPLAAGGLAECVGHFGSNRSYTHIKSGLTQEFGQLSPKSGLEH